MKVLLFGKNGQVGWELQRSLAPIGDLIALGSGSSDYCGDLRNAEGIEETIRRLRPDVIVNASAHTAVDKAENEPELAMALNATAPAVMAREAADLGAWLVHYSTDYVFDGSGDSPRTESDPTGPLNVYGATKLEGERSIQSSGCRHLIFRTSWVYAASGNNFAKTMLRLARERERLTVVSDQFGAPTGAELIADVTAHAIRTVIGRPELGGLYHLAASGEICWHGYATWAIDYARQSGEDLRVATIDPVATCAFPTAARRPLNSRLSTLKLRDSFGLTLPNWEVGVARMLREILNR
jgi:dTDP-4-dehydrorhamnose reductase